MTERLEIWLAGMCVAQVKRHAGKQLRLSYSEEALDAFDGGTPLLSWGLPLRAEYFPNGATRAFLDGLLPEGESRRTIAEKLDLASADTFGLLREIGRECAGALVVQPEGAGPPPEPTTLTAEPIDDEELERLVSGLRASPLGVGGRVRVSLGGVQEKLLLTRLQDGRWGRPVDGTPTTHILKPVIRGLEKTVENETLCMRLAKHMGSEVADVEMVTIMDHRVLVVERYDRRVGPSGDITRIHQEDMCQATSMPPSRKYQEDGGPALRAMAGILRATDTEGLDRFIQALVLNVILGNGDAHAKNFSLLHPIPGMLRLAPLYDLMCTTVYGQNDLAMWVDGIHRIDRVVTSRILREVASWGVTPAHAGSVVEDLLDRFPSAFEKAREEVNVGGDLVGDIEARFQRLLTPG